MKTLFLKEHVEYENTWGFKLNKSEYNYFELNNNNVKFKFCGFLSIDNFLIIIFPKGFSINEKNITTLEEDARLLIKVLEKYNKKSILYSSLSTNRVKTDNNNFISLVHEIIKDYLNNGLITHTLKSRNINGPGKTNWKKTMKKSLPIISNNNFIFLELVNEKTLRTLKAEIIEIHWKILKDIEDKVGWLFHFKAPVFSPKTKKMNVTKAKNTIKKTINTTYNQTIIQKLKYLYNYLDKSYYGDSTINSQFKLIFTFNFEYVWEDICKHIYDDKVELHQEVPIYKWGVSKKESKIIPDVLTQLDNENFLLIDAKYFPEINEGLGTSKLPPSVDISKQFMYYIALASTAFFENKNLYNVFILPAVVPNNTAEIDHVNFSNNEELDNKLKAIKAVQIDAENAMNNYLIHSIDFKEQLKQIL